MLDAVARFDLAGFFDSEVESAAAAFCKASNDVFAAEADAEFETPDIAAA